MRNLYFLCLTGINLLWHTTSAFHHPIFVKWEDCQSVTSPAGTSQNDICPVGANANSLGGTGYENDRDAQECPKGCYVNTIVMPNCTRCDWPFTTNWDKSPYCDAIQLVSIEYHNIVWALIILISAFILCSSIYFVAGTDKRLIIMSLVSGFLPLVDTITDIAVIFQSEIFNMVWIRVSDTMGMDEDNVCSGVSPFTLLILFIFFTCITPSIRFIKYILFDLDAQSRMNKQFPCPFKQNDQNETLLDKIIVKSWYCCVNILMLPWLIVGAIFYHMGLIGINEYWNFWITIWIGPSEQSHPFLRQNGGVHAQLISMSQVDHFNFETFPMFFLYLFDFTSRGLALVNQDNTPTPFVYGFTVTFCFFVVGLFTRLYGLCTTSENEHNTVEISLPIIPGYLYLYKKLYNADTGLEFFDRVEDLEHIDKSKEFEIVPIGE